MTEPENHAEALKRLRENLASFDAEVQFELENEGERADLWTGIDVNVEDLRTVLASLPEAPAVPVVKALEWGDIRGDGSLVAFPDIGLAYIASDKAWGHRNYPDQHPVDGGIEAAKAGAQADFEARIRSALQSSPPVKAVAVDGEVLRKAFEAARYQPGDHPVVPVKIATFMKEVERILAAKRGQTP